MSDKLTGAKAEGGMGRRVLCAVRKRGAGKTRGEWRKRREEERPAGRGAVGSEVKARGSLRLDTGCPEGEGAALYDYGHCGLGA